MPDIDLHPICDAAFREGVPEEASAHDGCISGQERGEEVLGKSEEEAKRLARELELLAKISRIVGSTLKIEEVYDRFAEEVRKLIPLDRISIGLFNLESGTIENAYVSGVEVADRRAGNSYPLAGSLGEQIMRGRKSLLVQTEDPREILRYFPRLLTTFQAGLRSMLSVPLVSNGQVIGILHIRSFQRNAYSEKEVNLGERVADQIAGAIVNARLYSELKQAKETLQRKEEEFRELYDHAPLGYHEYNREGKITRVNKTDLEMLGYRAEEMIDQPMWKFNVEDNLAKEQILAKLAGRLPPGKNLVRTYRRKDGSTFPVLIEDRLIKDEKGEILGIRCTIQDITERKRVEEALGKSEEEAKRLAQENFVMAEIGRIVSSTPIIEEVYERFGEELGKLISFDRIAVNMIDTSNNTLAITYVLGSPAPERELRSVFPLGGTAAEEILRTRSSLFIQGKNRSEVAERYPGLLPILNAGYQSIIMAPLISKNEVIGVFNVQSKRAEAYGLLDLKLIERVSIQISGAIANAQLFAERRRMLEQFMRSEERYRNLVERSPDMILLHKKGKLVYVNPAAVRILGASKPDDLIGKSVFEIIHPDYWDIVKERIAQVEGSVEVPLLEEEFIRLDGTSVAVEVMASTIFYREEPLVQVVARDISERKRAAEKMAALQTQLFQSQKMEAIGQLAGGFAHDFNNSLTLIKTCTQLTLLELRENDPLREKIEMIHEAVDRSANLSRHLLAFSRRQVMEMKVVNLNAQLKDLDRMLRRVIGEDIELVCSYAQDLGRVKVDPVQIEQVVLNLVINARDAMPRGGKLIIETSNIKLDEKYTSTHVSGVPGRYVLLSLSDTGVGMTREIRERAFEPFFTTKGKGKGTGLGLSTAYGIVKQSGGYIWAYSEPGMGSTFKIYLPKVEGPADEEKGGHPGHGSPCGGETVLVVEDENNVRQLVGSVLTKQGYKVLEASNGGEALLICEEHKDPIHLMVTDVVMPGMSGPKLAERLHLVHPEMKVLHMSGYAHDVITHHGILEKGINFIQKPFSIEKLSDKVWEVLNH